MHRTLPEKANLDHLKAQAKRLLKGLKAGELDAINRVIGSHPRFSEKSASEVVAFAWKISDAQFALAKEYGYKSWERLKSEVEKRAEDRFNVRQIIPLIPVSDMSRSLAFYEGVLGFAKAGQALRGDSIYWCRLKKDGAQIMLEEGEKNFIASEDPMKLCFITKDVDRVYAQLVANGLSVDEPRDSWYGMRQIFLKDPDQHVIWFESPLSEKGFKDYTE